MIDGAPEFCPICKNAEGLKEIEMVRAYRIFYCPKCTAEFSYPLDDTEQLYQKAYAGRNGFGQYALKMKTAKDVLAYAEPSMLISYERAIYRKIRKELPPKSVVLDIGCGYGRFLAVLRKASFVPVGIDIAGPPIKLLQQEGYEAYQGTVEAYPKQLRNPDAITIMEVLEHVVNPVAFISEIRSRFPDSRLYISVPSHRRWLLKKFPREASDYPPHHWYHFTPEALRYILETNGYGCEVKEPLVSPLSLGGGLRRIISRIEGEKVETDKSTPSIAVYARKHRISPAILSVLRKSNKLFKFVAYTPLAVYYNILGYRATSFIGEATPLTDKPRQ